MLTNSVIKHVSLPWLRLPAAAHLQLSDLVKSDVLCLAGVECFCDLHSTNVTRAPLCCE
jgi:hypothetical protein